MKSLLSLILAFSAAKAFSCSGVGADTKETVVIVDLNFIYGEVETARKAACKDGKRLVVLPYGYDYHKKLGLLREEIYRTESYYDYNKCPGGASGTKCQKLWDKKRKLKKALRAEKKKIKHQWDTESLEKDFQKLAAEGREIHSLILSGHDGSGRFHGYAGGLNKEDVAQALFDAFKEHPEKIDKLQSVYLWGCYTATRYETEQWSKKFPQLEKRGIIAGYQGAGPSIGKRASTDILYDIMSSENEIVAIRDANRLSKKLKSLDGLPYLLFGMQVNSCGGAKHYIGRNYNFNNRLSTEFGKADLSSCSSPKANRENSKNYKKFMQYYKGELPIPEDTKHGELRAIYNFSRVWQHCSGHWQKPGESLDPDQVALLLFYEGVKGNFWNSFGGLISEALTAIKALHTDDMDFLDTGEEELVESNRKAKLKTLLLKLPVDKSQFTSMSRKQLNEYNQLLHELTASELAGHPGAKPMVKSINKLKKAMNIYAYGLDPHCMDMLPWHEDEKDDNYKLSSEKREGCKVD